MQESIDDLLHQGWVRKFRSQWCSKVVLAPKPHQEQVTNIIDFVWRFCVNFRLLNAVTKPFEFPIPRCDDAMDNFGDSKGTLHFICVDQRTGYHQIPVAVSSQEKLAFQGPNHEKYCYTVMPFGPMNAPAVYTAMMKNFKDEYDHLFRQRFPQYAAFVGNKNIMDDSLLWATDPMVCLRYFRCMCEVFTKYRLSFNPKKCDFFLKRFEWLGHDVKTDGNSPAASKFNLIEDWPLPSNGTSLLSFLGLITYYSKYIPNYEEKSRLLRILAKSCHRQPIPLEAWSPALQGRFADLKKAVTSDPCTARFDSSVPIFLKTDWSNVGMSFVVMQPADDEASRTALEILEAGGPNTFDELMSGARLRPIRFGSRRGTPKERHFHSFVGEATAGRWAISQCRRYLWGTLFHWMCDCSSLTELFDYTGDIHQICRIAQELLGFHFTFVHRPARMMRDVDACNRFYYDPLVREYELQVNTSSFSDREARPACYSQATFPEFALKCPTVLTGVSTTIPLVLATSSSSHSMLCCQPLNLRFPQTSFPLNFPVRTVTMTLATTQVVRGDREELSALDAHGKAA